MQLDYAFVAESAQFTSDGKLWVLGGDLDTLGASSFPARHPTMTLAVKLRVQPTECARAHRLRVELLEPDGGHALPSLELEFTPQVNPKVPHRAVGMGVALNVQGATFPRAGDYGFHILVDDLEVGVVSLYLIQVPQAGEPPAPRTTDAG